MNRALAAAAGPVDCAVAFVEDTPLQPLGVARPHLLVKGWGGEVAIVEHVEGWSTSDILKRILRRPR